MPFGMPQLNRCNGGGREMISNHRHPKTTKDKLNSDSQKEAFYPYAFTIVNYVFIDTNQMAKNMH